MARPTLQHPELGDARTRLLDAARDVIRRKGFPATSVDDLCAAAGVSKGAFFHHFPTKEALGVAAAGHWEQMTGEFFAAAPYHQPSDPLDRVLAYVAFRRSMIGEDVVQFSCLVGTMVQDVHETSPAIRDACGKSIFGHASTLDADIAAAMAARGVTGISPQSLARHTQTVIQGAFILAKAGNDPAFARESLDHLERYIRLIFRLEDE